MSKLLFRLVIAAAACAGVAHADPVKVDTVAKVVLHWGSEILRAAGATFV